MLEIVIIVLVFVAFIWYYIKDESRRKTLSSAKSQGIIIRGEHYKVYKLYRCSSYTDGGVYVKHHDVHYFKEIVLVSSDNKEYTTTEERLLFCLKKRKHQTMKEIDGKWTDKWAEWEIDPDGWDERGLSSNDVYLGLY